MLEDLKNRLAGAVQMLMQGAESLLGAGGNGDDVDGGKGLVALVTPRAAEGKGRAIQALMAGGTLAALGAATAVAMAAIAWLVGALAAIYFLLTKVLGLKMELDPSAFAQPT
jgi:hypothetical protein